MSLKKFDAPALKMYHAGFRFLWLGWREWPIALRLERPKGWDTELGRFHHMAIGPFSFQWFDRP